MGWIWGDMGPLGPRFPPPPHITAYAPPAPWRPPGFHAPHIPPPISPSYLPIYPPTYTPIHFLCAMNSKLRSDTDRTPCVREAMLACTRRELNSFQRSRRPLCPHPGWFPALPARAPACRRGSWWPRSSARCAVPSCPLGFFGLAWLPPSTGVGGGMRPTSEVDGCSTAL